VLSASGPASLTLWVGVVVFASHGCLFLMHFTLRDRLIDEVKHGLLTPEQAEAEAVQRGLGPLATTPDLDNFDPMSEAHWTLTMAAAWIAFRTTEAVREWWDKYRDECQVWRFQPWRLGLDGPVKEGHFLERRPRATLALFQILQRREPGPNQDPRFSMAPKDAVGACG
jgi:hypothetical protein